MQNKNSEFKRQFPSVIVLEDLIRTLLLPPGLKILAWKSYGCIFSSVSFTFSFLHQTVILLLIVNQQISDTTPTTTSKINWKYIQTQSLNEVWRHLHISLFEAFFKRKKKKKLTVRKPANMQIKRKKKKVPNSKPGGAAPLSSSMFFSFLLKTEKLKTHNSRWAGSLDVYGHQYLPSPSLSWSPLCKALPLKLCLTAHIPKAVPSHPAEMSQYVVSAARLWVVLKCWFWA